MLVAGAYERHEYDVLPSQWRAQGLGELTWRAFPWFAAVVRAEAQAGSAGGLRRLTPILSVHPRINLKVQAYAVIDDVRSRLAGYQVSEIDVGSTFAF
jgi:hypothetical protein